MNDPTHDRISELFAELCELDDASRERRMREIRGDDRDAAEKLAKLLAADVRWEQWDGASPLETPEPFPSIPGYRITEVIGRGGAGIVYRAHQDNPSRDVALKLLRSDMASERMLARFELESEVLGYLRHSSIATILEAGTHETPDGKRPWFAMEFVEGEHLDDWARERPVREVVERFLAVCSAVQHAHQRGVIHRDLKPDNIRVTADGTPKVMDFGIARLIDSNETAQTQHGDVLGTLSYMSPEQLSGDPAAIDARADVYGLGLTLYAAITGRRPYDVTGRPITEALRIVQEGKLARLGTVVADARGDLEVIVHKAASPDRNQRYPSAEALLEDLERYLHHRPIEARRPTLGYQMSKLLRRQRKLVPFAAVGGLLLLATTVGMVMSFLEMKESRKRATQRTADLEEILKLEDARLAELDFYAMGKDIEHQLILLAKGQPFTFDVNRLQSDLDRLSLTEVARGVARVHIYDSTLKQVQTRFLHQPLLKRKLLRRLIRIYEESDFVGKALEIAKELLALTECATDRREDELEVDLLTAAKLERNAGGAAGVDASEKMLQRLLRRLRGRSADDPLLISARAALGMTYFTKGEALKSLPLLESTLQARVRTDGENSAKAAVAMSNLALALSATNNLARARQLEERSLELLKRSPQNRVLLVRRMISTSSAWLRDGRFDQALAVAQQAHKLAERIHGSKHRTTLAALNNYGTALFSAGQLRAAIGCFEQAVKTHRRIDGRESEHTLLAMNNLGTVLHQAGELERARAIFASTYAIRKRVFGETAASTMVVAGSLGSTLSRLGQTKEAREILEKTVALMRKRLGPTDPRTLRVMSNLALLYEEMDERDRGIQLMQQVLNQRERAPGVKHPSTLTTLYNLARMLEDGKKLDRALSLTRRALEKTRDLKDKFPIVQRLIDLETKLSK